MAANRVIEPLDVVEDIPPSGFSMSVDFSPHSLGFQLRQEPFSNRILTALTSVASAGFETMICKEVPQLSAGILRCFVRMDRHFLGKSSLETPLFQLHR